MKPVIVHGEAEQELIDGVQYYEDRSLGLGVDLKIRAQNAIREIARTPTRFGYHRIKPFRRVQLTRFPYSIVYLELDEVIWIAAVAHDKRRPGYWLDRKP